jgi:hypothetical protein
MPWEVRGGRTVRVSDDIQVVVEKVTTLEVGYVCDECDKVYKTKAGLENHVADKH